MFLYHNHFSLGYEKLQGKKVQVILKFLLSTIFQVKTLHARGIQAAKINDFKEALTLFDEALEINEKDAAVLHARSLVGLQMGNFDAALQDAKYLINIEPRSSQVWYWHGLNMQRLVKEEFH